MTGPPVLRARPLVLIGSRGVGKTAVGARLAARLAVAFIDTDAVIQAAAGQSIAAIFSERGEPLFREIEAAAVAEAIARPNRIVSVGGGAVLRQETRRLLRLRAFCVWLTADSVELARRLSADPQSAATRPALTGHAPEIEIAQLAEQRAPLYAEVADATVETTGLTIDAVCDEVLAAIDR